MTNETTQGNSVCSREIGGFCAVCKVFRCLSALLFEFLTIFSCSSMLFGRVLLLKLRVFNVTSEGLLMG